MLLPGKRRRKMTNWKDIIAAHNFLEKLYELYNEDGMMRCMYELFRQCINMNTITSSDLFLLSIVQDEYLKAYKQYCATQFVFEMDGLNRILSDKNIIKMEQNSQTHPLIIEYLHFIRAEGKFYSKDLQSAIHDYLGIYEKICAQYRDNTMSSIDKQKCMYLLNAVAWTYYLMKDTETAIKWYNKMFNEFDDFDKAVFSWRYRRNYGVCLDMTHKYLEAIDQYKKAIYIYSTQGMESRPNEYKIYLVYCSAIMKYWDEETGKVTGKWVERVIEAYNKKMYNISDDTFMEIEAMLQLVSLILRNNKVVDYYSLMTKLLIYKMIITTRKDRVKKYISEIEKNIRILEAVSSGSIKGYHFIVRDFYYALYVISNDDEQKNESYLKAWEENQALSGKGDSIEFGRMLMQKKPG